VNPSPRNIYRSAPSGGTCIYLTANAPGHTVDICADLLNERSAFTTPNFGESYRVRQGGEIGRRVRLRIPKSSIPKRSFSFQKTSDLQGENTIFRDQHRVHDREVKTWSF